MPSPVRPADFAATVPGQSSDFCTKFKLVFLELPNLLSTFMAWALSSDGSISDSFKAEVNPFSAGDIKITAASAIPSGWLKCEGQAVSRTTYAALFAAIGVVYGTGDGSTTFNLPDYRNRVLLGVTTTKVLGATGGEENHTLTEDEIATHRHNTFDASYGLPRAHNVSEDDRFIIGCPGTTTAWPTVAAFTTGTAGGGGAHNNMQPYVAAYFLIKT